MFRLIRYLGLLVIAGLIFSCSGSKQAGSGEQPVVGDAQTQTQIKDLLSKIEEQPQNLEYRRQLSVVYQQNGYNLESLKTLEDALQIDPNDAETKYLYAETAMSAGDHAKAYQAYKEVLQGLEGTSYLDRIAPKFSDAFVVEMIIGGPGNQAFGSFSSDGNKIIYQADTQGNWDIYEFDLGSQSTNTLVQTDAHEENPAYAPDGQKIVYTSTVEDHRDVDYDQKLRDIFVKDLTNDRAINLTTNGSDDWHPKYSPDGKYIGFVSERNDLRDVPFYERFANVFLMESDGRFQLELAHSESNNGSPSIAPGSTEDKGLVYFDSNRNGRKAIYQVDFKGENLRQITFNPENDDVGPDISPSGDKIVFFSNRDDNFEIYMMNNDGSAQQRLTSNAADDLNPVFSPDGRKVIFHSNRNGNFDIFLMNLDVQSSGQSVAEVVNKIDQALSRVH